MIIAGLNIYPMAIQGFLKFIILLEINTMIDFVKFDTVRNEITIGDQTLRLLENSAILD